MDIRVITPEFSAAPQLEAADMQAVADAGFKTVICNRPDGEDYGQCECASMRAAAEAAGLTFYDIPFAGGIAPETLAAFDQVMDEADAPVLAYCRTGTRSTTIWALSMARTKDAADLIEAAANGGYDLSHMGGMLASRRV